MKHKRVEVGQMVMVYCRYRLAVPMVGTVEKKSKSNDGVAVNVPGAHPLIKQPLWVHAAQLRKRQQPEVLP